MSLEQSVVEIEGRTSGGGDVAVKAAAGGRSQSLEIGRIVAAFFIVGYHSTARGHDIFYAGLVFFLMASPFMEVRYNYERQRSPGQLARLFLLPWAFWLVVYGAFNLIRGRPAFPAELDLLSGVLYGSSGHLWFLPFMFAVLLLLATVKRLLRPPGLFWGSLAICAALLLASPVVRPWSLEQGPPASQWIHAAPAVFAGVVLGLAPVIRHGRAGIGVLAIVLGVTFAYDIRGISLAYPLGALLLFLAATGPERVFARFDVEQVSRCMLGVFLVHLFWLSLARPIFPYFDLAGVAAAFLGALASVWLTRRFVPASKAVLG